MGWTTEGPKEDMTNYSTACQLLGFQMISTSSGVRYHTIEALSSHTPNDLLYKDKTRVARLGRDLLLDRVCPIEGLYQGRSDHWTLQIFKKISTSILQHSSRTPWPETASELYRPSDSRLSAKIVPTLADKKCHVVSVMNPYCRNLGLLDRSRYFFFQLYSRG
jgi:hypothetical protein